MQPERDPHTLCARCQTFVRTANFLIHEARCKGLSSQSRSSSSPSYLASSSRRSSRIFPPQQQQQQGEQKIPCHFCGYGQTLVELDVHPNTCAHRQTNCSDCNASFPLSLLGQHRMFCSARSSQELGEEEDNSWQEIHEQQQERPRQQHGRRQELRRPENIFEAMNMMMQGMSQQRGGNRQESFSFFLGGPSGGRMRGPSGGRMGGPSGGGMPDIGAMIEMLAFASQEHHESKGLSEKQLKQFKIVKFDMHKNLDEQEKCVVCYCDFEHGDECLQLACKHQFHPDCVKKWLQKNPLCPVCKQDSLGRKKPEPSEEDEDSHHGFPRIIFGRR